MSLFSIAIRMMSKALGGMVHDVVFPQDFIIQQVGQVKDFHYFFQLQVCFNQSPPLLGLIILTIKAFTG
jgi:hypothetical protein